MKDCEQGDIKTVKMDSYQYPMYVNSNDIEDENHEYFWIKLYRS